MKFVWFRIGRRPVLFLGVLTLVIGRCVSAFTAGHFVVFLVANVVASLPIAVVFQSPLIIGNTSETLQL
jgi:predicted MFS family arabinose efflux permease